MTLHTPLRRQADLLDMAKNRPGPWQDRGESEYGKDQLRRIFDRAAHGSELFWVAEDMMPVMEAAAEKLPPEPLRETDLPASMGLVCFSRSLEKPVQQKGGMLDWVMWSKVYRGDGPPVSEADAMRQGLPCDIFYFLGWRYGATYHPNYSIWPTGEPNPEVEPEHLAVARKLRAFWLLVQQPISVTERRQNHQTRKMAKRENLPTSEVKIVRLRRPRQPPKALDEHLGTTVEWSHQWIVNGHWRNQYLPSIKGHRLQWIAPYVKGPEDKPLVVKKTVNAWVR